jgi:IclR family acetate operon transcriptional repressor
VQSVERAFRLLEELVLHDEISLGKIARLVGIHKSTAYRLLQTLVAFGYAEQGSEPGSYRVGIRLVELGSAATRSWPLHRVAQPIMDLLAEELGEAVNLAVEDGLEMVYIATVDAYSPLRMQLAVGRRAPMHCTAVGKVLLAHVPELMDRLRATNRDLARYTPRTITDWDRLQDELGAVRNLGFAVDNEEQEIGARCVAAPVADSRNRIVAAVGISAPSARLTYERAVELGPVVSQAAHRISARLGSLRNI